MPQDAAQIIQVNEAGNVQVIDGSGRIIIITAAGISYITVPNPTIQGSLFYVSASNVVTLLPPGTSGYYLKTLGNGVDPVWVALPAAPIGYSLASTITVSSATTTGNIPITNTKQYMAIVKGLDVSAGANTIRIRFNGDTGNNYNSGYSGIGASAAITASSANSSGITTCTALTASTQFNMNFNIIQDGTNANYMNAFGMLSAPSGAATGGAGTVSTFGGQWVGGATPTSFSVIGSGNWTGVLYLYEITTV